MIKVSVLYPHVEAYRFDMDYYVSRHVAMIRELLGDALIRCEIDQGVCGSAPASTPPFVAAVHMYFDSTDAFYTAFGPHARTINKDVANYTDIRPTMQVSSVLS